MLTRLGLELTTRCNLRCRHCLREVPAAPVDFPVPLLDRVLGRAREAYATKSVTLTGGEPLLHPELEGALEAIVRHDFTFSLITNGVLLPARLQLLCRPEFKARIGHVAVSLNGADERTHDAIRGPGSYRQAMTAVLGLKSAGIPFALKYTLGTNNLDSIEAAVIGMAHLGPDFIELSHMTPTPDNVREGLMPTPAQLKESGAVVARLAQELKCRVAMSAGGWTEQTFFTCAALAMQEFYVDARGWLCFCCVLPGLRGASADGRELIADLNREDLCWGHRKLVGAIAAFQRRRIERIYDRGLTQMDHFPCLACARYFHKLDWLSSFPDAPWGLDRLEEEKDEQTD